MIVTAVLPWWNELPEDLDRCVRAAGNVADRIVALDGAYRRYPGATVRSPDDQVDAIKTAAAAVGMECRIVQPDTLWAGQIEKRTALLNLVLDETDWIATIDADHIIHTDRERVRAELEHTNELVIDVPYWTPANKDRSTFKSAAGIWHIDQTKELPWIPHLWQALPGMRVERRHWWISGMRGSKRVWLWITDGDKTYPAVNHHRLTTPYKVEHRALFRTVKQVLASRAFLNDRENVVKLTGQEDDIPGLPPPVWDYKRMPK